jgi:hypothetical protein
MKNNKMFEKNVDTKTQIMAGLVTLVFVGKLKHHGIEFLIGGGNILRTKWPPQSK